MNLLPQLTVDSTVFQKSEETTAHYFLNIFLYECVHKAKSKTTLEIGYKVFCCCLIVQDIKMSIFHKTNSAYC